MKIHQIRNATLKLTYCDKVFLIDPWLMPKGAFGTFQMLPLYRCPDPAMETIPMPMCDLPMSVEEVLDGVDAYIITHVHPDHIDMSFDGIVGTSLDKSVTTFVQNESDCAVMQQNGFKDVRVLTQETQFDGVSLCKTEGLHGTIKPCGDSCGVVFKADGEKVLYVAGDTVWFEGVEKALVKHAPDVIIVNACAATLIDEGRLIMDVGDIEKVRQEAPDAVIVASHMDTVPHATLTRKTLQEALAKRAVQDVIIVKDNETLSF